MSAEPKRVSLKAVPSVANTCDRLDNNHKKSKNGPKEAPKEPKTRRFTVTLRLSEDTDEFNEFSFNELMKTSEDKDVCNRLDSIDLWLCFRHL